VNLYLLKDVLFGFWVFTLGILDCACIYCALFLYVWYLSSRKPCLWNDALGKDGDVERGTPLLETYLGHVWNGGFLKELWRIGIPMERNTVDAFGT